MDRQLKWYEKSGQDGDCVCSTRIRLARNLSQYPFPNRASLQKKQEIKEKIEKAMLSGNSILSREFTGISLENISEQEAVSLVERHLVSPEFISDKKGKAVLVSADESISVMINEEDHVRIQVMKEGLALKEAAELADKIDTLLGETLDFAFDREFGYLTQCPTNLGTGLRASVMLHLPALAENGAMPRIADNLSKLGLVLRGTYGEGSFVYGGMYQLSNQITLGLSENEAIENLSAISQQLIGEERKLRQEMSGNISIQDKIDRAAGVLKSAKMLSHSEFMELTSYVRLGLNTGLLHGISEEELNTLSIEIQPGTLMSREGKELDQNQRDILRAELTRGLCTKLKE